MARRWNTLGWLPATQLPDGSHRVDLTVLDQRLNPHWEYRLLYDSARGLWRLDRRAHADGG